LEHDECIDLFSNVTQLLIPLLSSTFSDPEISAILVGIPVSYGHFPSPNSNRLSQINNTLLNE
jgi:hypothetical protein